MKYCDTNDQGKLTDPCNMKNVLHLKPLTNILN